MFVILLATLLFCVRGSNANSGASEWGEKLCSKNNFCITLNDGEITAEAGLCAVIPCSFSPRTNFIATDLAWVKCEPLNQRCFDSDRIFHTKNSEIPQITFKGRVSLLEPDVSQKNCSIIINDLTESDSGSYWLRIIGNTPQKKGDGFTFTQKATVSVKGLTQKPTVKVPPLTAGQQTTLTCIAPGLCSGSEPEITWMWRGAGGKHITGNITDFKTENLTSVTQRHSSTLTFNPSAEHHGTKVTCKVSFINNISTEETVTLNLTWAAEREKESCHNNFCITLNDGEITAEAGLCAVIPCSFSSCADFTATDLTWMKCESSKERCDQSDEIFHTKTIEIVQSGFKGRVSLLEPDVSLKNCSIIINELTESDSGSYQLRIIGSTPQKKEDGFTFTPKATVSVKDLTQKPTVKVPPLTAGQQTTLICIAPGLCSGSEPEITWMWRGAGGKHITGNITDFKTENLTSVTQRHISTLTFNATAEHHGTKVTCKVSFINNISTEETVTLNLTWASEWGEKSCQKDFCITLNDGEITAEAGLCAVIPCSFSSRADFTATDLTWMKCESSKQNCAKSDSIFHTKTSEIVQSGFKGRVSLLEPDVSLRNCSIIINDLTESDSGSYQLRIIKKTPLKEDAFTFTPKSTVSVKGLTQKPTVKVPPLTAGQQTTLTCIAPGLCSGSEPEITWMWRGAGGKHITGNITDFKTESLTSVTQRHSSTLTFNPSAEHQGTKVTCKVSFINNISTEETVILNVTCVVQQCSAVLPWTVAAVSLVVNVICIICLIFLWNTKKKVKPKQEDRTYMSLQKRDTSPEYDVIGQPRN